MKQISLFILILFAFTACQEPASKSSETATKAAVSKQTKVSTSEYPFPVYKTFDELAYIFEQQTDTTYIINFWATWCKPCVEELPYFEALQQKYAAEKVRTIYVSLDFPKDIHTKLIPFVEDRKITNDVMLLLDGSYNKWIDKVDPDWGGAIPVTVIYGKGKRVFHQEPFEDTTDLEAAFLEVYQAI